MSNRWRGLLQVALLGLGLGAACGGASAEEAPGTGTSEGSVPLPTGEAPASDPVAALPEAPQATPGTSEPSKSPPTSPAPPASPAPDDDRRPEAASGKPWSLRQGGPQDDTGAAVAVGRDQDVLWVVSSTPREDEDREGVEGQKLALTLSRYAPDGTRRWTREFERNRISEPRVAASTGSEGAVFLTGNAFLYAVDFGLGAAEDGFLVKFTADGAPVWQRRVGQKVYGVAADATGGAVAVGEEWTAEAHTPVLTRYGADGVARWTRRFDGAAEGTSLAALALAPSGQAVVAGQLVGQVTLDGQTFGAANGRGFVVLAFGADGTLAWGRELPGARGRVTSVSVGASGAVALAGEFQGLLLWNGATLDSGGPFVATVGADGRGGWLRQPACGAASVGPSAAVEAEDAVAVACGDVLTRYAADGGRLGEQPLPVDACASGTCSLAATAVVAVPGQGLGVTGWERDGAGDTWNQEAFLRLVVP